jgi:hypothetical protein
MNPLRPIRRACLTLACLLPASVWGGYFPMYASWPQPGGAGSPITLTYSYSKLLDGSMASGAGIPISASVLKSAFEQAFADYTAILPIHFVEVADAGPLPETGQYDSAGLTDIRIGQVAHIDDANAYAYFPMNTEISGLAGDIVFNAERFGFGWTATLFYAVAQHELGHTLGMGHSVEGAPGDTLLVIEGSIYVGPLFPLDAGMAVALQGVYGAGTGSVTPLSPVPEPAGWISMLAGLALVVWRRSWKLSRFRRSPPAAAVAGNATHSDVRHVPQRPPAGYATLFGNHHD